MNATLASSLDQGLREQRHLEHAPIPFRRGSWSGVPLPAVFSYRAFPVWSPVSTARNKKTQPFGCWESGMLVMLGTPKPYTL